MSLYSNKANANALLYGRNCHKLHQIFCYRSRRTFRLENKWIIERNKLLISIRLPKKVWNVMIWLLGLIDRYLSQSLMTTIALKHSNDEQNEFKTVFNNYLCNALRCVVNSQHKELFCWSSLKDISFESTSFWE